MLGNWICGVMSCTQNFLKEPRRNYRDDLDYRSRKSFCQIVSHISKNWDAGLIDVSSPRRGMQQNIQQTPGSSQGQYRQEYMQEKFYYFDHFITNTIVSNHAPYNYQQGKNRKSKAQRKTINMCQ